VEAELTGIILDVFFTPQCGSDNPRFPLGHKYGAPITREYLQYLGDRNDNPAADRYLIPYELPPAPTRKQMHY
jgi:hypothetical protein